MNQNNLIAISSGDPSGIGPEITIKALKLLNKNQRNKIILIGEEYSLKKVGYTTSLAPLINVHKKEKITYGKDNALSGEISFKAFNLAVKLINSKKISKIVTAPISKKAWKMAGVKYLGHTDYFRKTLNIDPLMSFFTKDFKLALITEHLPLKDVSSHLNKKDIINKVSLFKKYLNPKDGKEILISALNPHSGEAGEIGKEEENIIKPTIKILNNKEIKVSGPYNSDSILNIYKDKKALGAIFMYHDQLLAPLKAKTNPFEIVHLTLGLPFIRTSPTHGTAFDIAGKNIANPLSMFNAIIMALNF